MLPYAREQLPTGDRFARDAWIFRLHMLERLESFGLLEDGRDQGFSDPRYRVTPLYGRFLTFVV